MNRKILIGAGIVTLLIIVIGLFLVMRGENSEGGLRNLFPFGRSEDTLTLPQNPSIVAQTDPGTVSLEIALNNGLRKISSAAVSDAHFLDSATGTVARFIERATGHIFEADLISGNISRISNTTIPKIESVAWGVPGETFLAQKAETGAIESTVVEITMPTGTTTEEFARVDEFPLQDNILFPSFSPSGERMFYLTKALGGGIEGYIADGRGGSPALAWEFPITEWLTEWPTANTIFLTSKASNGVGGALYALNASTKASSLVLSGITGLTSKASPSGENILYSSSEGNSLSTYILRRGDQSTQRLPMSSLAEKCVWREDSEVFCAEPRSVSQNAPDDWYQGIVSYDDQMWRFNLETGESQLVSELSTLEGDFMDVLNPKLSAEGDYLLFMNKKDLSLWALPLER